MAIFFRIPEVCQKSKFSASFFVPLKLYGLSAVLSHRRTHPAFPVDSFQFCAILEEETDRCLRADAKPQNKKFGGNEYEIRTYL